MGRFDVIVIDGRLAGSALADGARPRPPADSLLDEGDATYRVSRGNSACLGAEQRRRGAALTTLDAALCRQMAGSAAEIRIAVGHQRRAGCIFVSVE
jgi:hypothetical protein